MQSRKNEILPRCTLCDQTFHSISLWREHRRTSHNIEIEYQCPECEFRINDTMLLNYHLKEKHHSKWQRKHTLRLRLECEEDGLLFQNRKLASQRERGNIKKPGPKEDTPYPCGKCNDSFAYEQQYVKHAREAHGVNLFYCKTCFLIRESQAELDEHLKEKPCIKRLVCSECDARFFRLPQLTEHEATHACENWANSGIETRVNQFEKTLEKEVLDIDTESLGSTDQESNLDNSNAVTKRDKNIDILGQHVDNSYSAFEKRKSVDFHSVVDKLRRDFENEDCDDPGYSNVDKSKTLYESRDNNSPGDVDFNADKSIETLSQPEKNKSQSEIVFGQNADTDISGSYVDNSHSAFKNFAVDKWCVDISQILKSLNMPIEVIDIDAPSTESSNVNNSHTTSRPNDNDTITHMDNSNVDEICIQFRPKPIEFIDIDPPSMESSKVRNSHTTSGPKDNHSITPMDNSNVDEIYIQSQPTPIEVIDIEPPSTESSNVHISHTTSCPKDSDTITPIEVIDIEPPSTVSLTDNSSCSQSQPTVIEVMDIYSPIENINADNFYLESQFAAILSPSNSDNSRAKSHQLKDKVIPSNNTDNSNETSAQLNSEIIVIDTRSLTTDNSETKVSSQKVGERNTNDKPDGTLVDNLNQELSTQNGTTLQTNATTCAIVNGIIYESQVCPLCQQTVSNFEFLAKHVVENHYVLPYQCNLSIPCQFSCLKREELIEHLAEHSVQDQLKILVNPQCLDCDKRFWSLKSWKCHMSKRHKGILKNTSGHRSRENKFVCQICGDKFPHQVLLSIHEGHLHRASPWNCGECQVSTDLKNDLYKHKMLAHKLTPIYEIKPTCRLCSLSFGSINLWQDHRRDVFSKGDGCASQNDAFVNQTSTDIETVATRCISKNCDKIFPSMSDYVTHRETEHQTIQCPLVCDFRTFYKEQFLRHLRNTHVYQLESSTDDPKEPQTTAIDAEEPQLTATDAINPSLATMVYGNDVFGHSKKSMVLRCNAPNCEQVFNELRDYQAHRDSQHPHTYQCHLRCEFKTEIRRELTQHLRDYHGKVIAMSIEDSENEIKMPIITKVLSLREFMPSFTSLQDNGETMSSDSATSCVHEKPDNEDFSQSTILRENSTASLYDNIALNGVSLASQWSPKQFKIKFQPFISLNRV